VHEEGQIGGAGRLTDVVCHIHQLIIVDPDKVVGATVGGQGLSELAVDLHIGVPVLGIELTAGLEVVEQRPHALVRIPVIVVIDLFLGEREGLQGISGSKRGFVEDFRDARHVFGGSGPPDPDAAPAAQNREERGHQTA
jgi:hypothetical protein